jgi:hypothetical protein
VRIISYMRKRWGRCEVLQKINYNKCKLRLLSHMTAFDVLNMKHLTPCIVDVDKDDKNSIVSSS